MNQDVFREIALSFAGAIEKSHMTHPDFRAGKKQLIYASLGSPTTEWGMVKLTPEQQAALIESDSEVFQPCSGAWGQRGYTNVKLQNASKKVIKIALQLAYENVTI